jgi:hypothetical protein
MNAVKEMRTAFLFVVAAAFAIVPMSASALPRELQNLRVHLESKNGSDESGTAILTAAGNQTRVTISVVGEPAGAAQPANIQAGRCGSVEVVKYALQYVRDGRSISLVALGLDALKASHLVINLQASVKDLHAPKDARDVSCGAI